MSDDTDDSSKPAKDIWAVVEQRGSGASRRRRRLVAEMKKKLESAQHTGEPVASLQGAVLERATAMLVADADFYEVKEKLDGLDRKRKLAAGEFWLEVICAEGLPPDQPLSLDLAKLCVRRGSLESEPPASHRASVAEIKGLVPGTNDSGSSTTSRGSWRYDHRARDATFTTAPRHGRDAVAARLKERSCARSFGSCLR